MATSITHKELTTVLSYDKDTGIFNWNPGVPNFAKYRHEVGSIDAKGRRYIHIHRQSYAAHRLAWFYVNGSWPNGSVVPKNGDYLDLRLDNLAIETLRDTALRSKDRSNNTSGMRGVSWDKSKHKWVAGITINYKRKFLGNFKTREEAAAAYRTARVNYFPDVVSADEVTQVRARAREDARYRSLFKRTLRNAAGLTGWSDWQHFRDDIGTDLHDRQSIVAVDVEKPIGPGNWKWETTLFYNFDTSTQEGRRDYERANRERNPLLHRDYNLRKSFGIGISEYVQMLDRQNGKCDCCKQPETETRSGKVKWLAVDHCHSTGEIRGLLCAACNKAIGMFGDNASRLRAAADYLERCAEKITANGVASHSSKDSIEGAHDAPWPLKQPQDRMSSSEETR